MNVDITSRVLPGIGVCQELELHDGHHIGIVTRRTGLRELVLYDEDGDGAAETITLSDDEANAVAEILGAPQLTFRLATLQRQAEGLIVEQLPVPADSPCAARPLGDTRARSRTGASIVAVLRHGAALLTIVLGAAVMRLPEHRGASPAFPRRAGRNEQGESRHD